MPMQQMLLGAGGKADPKYIDDYWSTAHYEGDGQSSRTVNNGIDFSSGKGMVFIVASTGEHDPYIFSTEAKNSNGSSKGLRGTWSNGYNNYNSYCTLTSTGMTVNNNNVVNQNGSRYIAHFFKAEKGFFDIVTYTGNESTRTISHSLGTNIGQMWVKRTDGDHAWFCYHKDAVTSAGHWMNLSNSNAQQNSGQSDWNLSGFTTQTFGLGSNSSINGSGKEYIAFIWSDGSDASWGEDKDEAIIKCGTYTGNGSENRDSPLTVNVGFEPSFCLFKTPDTTGDWLMQNTINGWGTVMSREDQRYRINKYSNTNQGASGSNYYSMIYQSGFKTVANINGNNTKYVYMAIRRMGQKPITSGSECFASMTATASVNNVPKGSYAVPTDMTDKNRTGDLFLEKRTNSSNDWYLGSRISHGYRTPTNKDDGWSSDSMWDLGSNYGFGKTYNQYHKGMCWARAHGFMDVQHYEGHYQNQTINHDLGVVPDLIWFKSNASANALITGPVIDNDWSSCLNLGTHNGSDNLNKSTRGIQTHGWNNSTAPTATQVTLRGSTNANSYKWTNAPWGVDHQMILWKQIDGVFKMGTYTGNGSNYWGIGINCGFTSGSRWVLIKKMTQYSNMDWWMTCREYGFNVQSSPSWSNSNLIKLNREHTLDGSDNIINQNSGFRAKDDRNYSGDKYFYMAIAT